MQKETSARKGRPALAAAYVAGQVGRLLGSKNQALARSSLARLRRGIGKAPGSLPDLWGLTLDGMPEDLVGTGFQPSRGEWACYLALTLFALHQQGKDTTTAAMHQQGLPLGRSLRRLVRDPDDEERIKRRFDQVVTADSPQEVAHYLRSLVQLLRADDIPLDYAALAADLYRFQNPDQRDGVRLRWGRDFYAGVPAAKEEEAAEPENEAKQREEQNHEEQ